MYVFWLWSLPGSALARERESFAQNQGADSRHAGRRRTTAPNDQCELERLEAALLTVAHQLDRDPAYKPIFERLEQEIAIEKEKQSNGALARARALIAQKTCGPSKS